MAHDRRSLPDLNFGPNFTKIRWARRSSRRPTRIARTLWLEDFNLRGGGGAVIIHLCNENCARDSPTEVSLMAHDRRSLPDFKFRPKIYKNPVGFRRGLPGSHERCS